MIDTKIDLSEKEMQRHLSEVYQSHGYKFYNTHFFAWESDFLSFLQSGYCWEFEIKRTRSDFKADFKKEKHKSLLSAYTSITFAMLKNNMCLKP